MPVFNGSRYLRQAVESVLTQTYPDFELVVVDDGSVDNTPALLGSYAGDRRVRIFRNNRNLGLSPSLNRGIEEARGEFIARMDADDVSLPDRLGRQVTYLEAHPEVGVVGGGYEPIDESGAPLGPGIPPPALLPAHVRWLLLLHNCLNHPTVVVRRDAVLAAGGYRRQWFPADDYDLWVRLAEHSGVANVADVVLQYRVHGANVTATFGDEAPERQEAVTCDAIARYLGAPPRPEAVRLLRHPHRHGRVVDQATLLAAARLLRALTQRALAAGGLSAAERSAIKRDAGNHGLRLAIACARARPAALPRILALGGGVPPRWLVDAAAGAATSRLMRSLRR